MEVLKDSVGRHGANGRHDVLTVQQLLNQNRSFLGPRQQLTVDGHCGRHTIDAILQYQQRVVHMHVPDGRVDPGGRTLKSLLGWSVHSVHLADSVRRYQQVQSPKAAAIVPVTVIAPAGGGNQLYTKDPNEQVTTHTLPSLAPLVSALRKAWPELTEDGARTLTAQCMHETAGGHSCYNWNLGNVKSSRTSVPHMYLRNVWECEDAGQVAGELAENKGLVHRASEKEQKQHGACAGGKTMLVYEPPSRQCRFRAYNSLEEGVLDWTGRYKRTATKHPGFMEALNRGDCVTFAKTLKLDRYYSGPESVYITNMQSKKAKIDQALGKP